MNLIARWGLPSNWRANRKKISQDMRENTDWNRTALNLETKVTHNTEGPGQTGRSSMPLLCLLDNSNLESYLLDYSVVNIDGFSRWNVMVSICSLDRVNIV